jgi:hypothetical protein
MVLVVKPGGSNHMEDPGIDGRIILNCVFVERECGHGVDRCGSGYGHVASWNGPSGCIKCGEFPD